MHGTETTRRVRARINRRRTVQEEELDLVMEYYALQARESFWAYRRFMDPTMTIGWWPHYLSLELQKFYEEMKRGNRPLWVLTSPPQHGKSRALTDFSSWLAGKEPDWKTIYASYSKDLGDKANAAVQRTMDLDQYQLTFPKTRLASRNARGDEAMYSRNSTLLEYIFRKGSFVNTTVQGQVNGKGFEFGMCDDLMKGRNEANSKRQRDKTWDWLIDDFKSRMSNEAGMLLLNTRWHIDDPIARFLKIFPQARLLNFPAIATADTEDVSLGYRKVGDPLFPEFKSLGFLKEQKKGMSQVGWESVYQQSPIIAGGGMIPIEMFRIVPQMFARDMVAESVRAWDKANNEGDGAYSSGTLMHRLKDGRFVIENVWRKQCNRHERERAMKQCAVLDDAKYGNVVIWMEQEPGSGGKDSAQMSATNLAGHTVFYERSSGDKATRADPFAGQVQAGNVLLVAGDWTQDFIDEAEAFPDSKYKDQIDSAAQALKKLALTSGYDDSLSWVG